MLVRDVRGNAITASGATPVALLDQAVDAYLGFRKDTGSGSRLRSRLSRVLCWDSACAAIS